MPCLLSPAPQRGIIPLPENLSQCRHAMGASRREKLHRTSRDAPPSYNNCSGEGNGAMRRSDHDVTNTIRTTDLRQVARETLRVYRGLYEKTPSDSIERAFDDLGRLYAGEHPDFQPCDTAYHDIQHVLDVTL